MVLICDSMVGREIWDKYHSYFSGSGKLHEGNTRGIYPKFHSQPCYYIYERTVCQLKHTHLLTCMYVWRKSQ